MRKCHKDASVSEADALERLTERMVKEIPKKICTFGNKLYLIKRCFHLLKLFWVYLLMSSVQTESNFKQQTQWSNTSP